MRAGQVIGAARRHRGPLAAAPGRGPGRRRRRPSSRSPSARWPTTARWSTRVSSRRMRSRPRRPTLAGAQASLQAARGGGRAGAQGGARHRLVAPPIGGHGVAALRAARRARRARRPLLEIVDLSRARAGRAAGPGRGGATARRPAARRLQRRGAATPVGGARRAHQPQHPGRHPRGAGLPGARPDARPAPGPVRARPDRDRSAAARWWCRCRRCASTRRRPYVLAVQDGQVVRAGRRARRARRGRASAAARARPRSRSPTAWPTALPCCAAASARCAPAPPCSCPDDPAAARRPSAMWFTRVSIAQPGAGHDGDAGLRRARACSATSGWRSTSSRTSTFPTVVVTLDYPGASPEIVEAEVTKKVEEAVNTVAGIDSMFSRSYEGSSVVVVQFNLDIDGRRPPRTCARRSR